MSDQESGFGSVEYTEKIALSFRGHVDEEPLFEPEADVAEKVVELMKSKLATRTTIAQIRDLMNSLDDQEHYDGSGWFEMNRSVEKWVGDQSLESSPKSNRS